MPIDDVPYRGAEEEEEEEEVNLSVVCLLRSLVSCHCAHDSFCSSSCRATFQAIHESEFSELGSP